jgi:hypothetical protein
LVFRSFGEAGQSYKTCAKVGTLQLRLSSMPWVHENSTWREKSATGKSGGYRLIYQVFSDRCVLLLLIYAKSDQADVDANEILEAIKEALFEDDWVYFDRPVLFAHFLERVIWGN